MVIKVKNLTSFNGDVFILVDNYFQQIQPEIWNCPDNNISRNSNSVGVWKIKQLKTK